MRHPARPWSPFLTDLIDAMVDLDQDAITGREPLKELGFDDAYLDQFGEGAWAMASKRMKVEKKLRDRRRRRDRAVTA